MTKTHMSRHDSYSDERVVDDTVLYKFRGYTHKAVYHRRYAVDPVSREETYAPIDF